MSSPAKRAYLLREVLERGHRARGNITDPVYHRCHFRVEPPIDGHSYVVVSAVNHTEHPIYSLTPSGCPFITATCGETYIFPADVSGITGWGELSGSLHGVCNVEVTLQLMGYEIVIESEEADIS